jgi:hypothetical protein
MKAKLLVAALFLSACETPEQPDLNTYGAVQPVCLFWCDIIFTLTEGEAGTSGLSSTVSSSRTSGGNSAGN